MTSPKKSIKMDTAIEQFQNNNNLKFHGPTLSHHDEENRDEFEFTSELVASIKSRRRLAKMPFKVLDAPALQDDFYLNLIDWGKQNFLAVGLASNVYLWNGVNSKVTKLCDLGLSDTVTSVGWAQKGQTFSLGTNNGEVHLWDLSKLKKIRVMHGHSNRVGSIAWNSSILSTGSRDKTILHRDPRCSQPYVQKSIGHKQEICGLKWSPDEQQLCSGGNDNKVMIWNSRSSSPVLKFSDHVAAVKAVAWSPHQHGLLASGGGTADRHIRFRNTLTG
jgi:cell division cycle 20-like protein 1 (cofactor of APC complex)